MSGKLLLEGYLIDMMDRLGSGTFGVVYRGKHKESNALVAAKQCDLKKSEKAGGLAMRELKHFQHLEKHPHVVKLLDFSYKLNSFWLIMEFCDAGDLDTYFYRTNPRFEEQKDIMFQCASALHYMHSRPVAVIHRDIKPQNIVMKKNNETAVVKVTDFGLSKMIEKPDPAMSLMFNTKCGTPGFMAPEFFQKGTRDYGRSVDIFSLGLVYLSMAVHRRGNHCLMPPKAGTMNAIGQQMAMLHEHGIEVEDVTKQIRGDDEVYVKLKALIRKMILFNPKERVKIDEVEVILADIGGKSPFTLPNPAVRDLSEEAAEGMAAMAIGPAADAKDTDEELGYKMVKKVIKDVHKANDLGKEKGARETGTISTGVRTKFSDISGLGRIHVGEKVQLDYDEIKCIRLQPGYGGWQQGMEKYLGQFGVVTGVRRNVKVKFEDGREFLFNPKLLIRTGEVPFTEADLANFEDQDLELIRDMFKRYDIVKFATDDPEVIAAMQQNTDAIWNPRITDCIGVNGVVIKVHNRNAIVVQFLNESRWRVHPDILKHIDMSMQKFEAGDMVIIMEKRDFIRKCKYGFVNWKEEQMKCLGEIGLVKAVRSLSEEVIVETGKIAYSWHPKLLQLFEKGEAVMEAILRHDKAAG